MTTEDDYVYLRRWGRWMGSYPHYINAQVARARQTDAPENAIYERDGRWITTDEVTNPEARAALGVPPLAGLEAIVLQRAHAERTGDDRITFATAADAVRWADQYSENFSSVTIAGAEMNKRLDEPMTLRIVL